MTLENQLKRKLRVKRILSGSATALFWIFFCVFAIMYSASAQVEHLDFGFFGYDKVTHNNSYAIISTVFLLMSCPAFVLWMGYLTCRCIATQCGNDHVLIYRGMIGNRLYINEVKVDVMEGMSFRYYLEGKLSDGSTVTVSFGKFRAVHLSFSNGHPAVDL